MGGEVITLGPGLGAGRPTPPKLPDETSVPGWVLVYGGGGGNGSAASNGTAGCTVLDVAGGGRRCSHGGNGSGANLAVPVIDTPYVWLEGRWGGGNGAGVYVKCTALAEAPEGSFGTVVLGVGRCQSRSTTPVREVRPEQHGNRSAIERGSDSPRSEWASCSCCCADTEAMCAAVVVAGCAGADACVCPPCWCWPCGAGP